MYSKGRHRLGWEGLLLLASFFPAAASWAGPPFVTDDPEPVEYRHWEIFLAATYFRTPDGGSGTMPQLDMSYGLFPEAHLNLLTPFAFNLPQGGSQAYGYGDTELALKFRFLRETPGVPQAALFPRLIFPTGDSRRGLGDGNVQLGIPLWLQKSWGPWTTYGGGAYWVHPGTGNKDWVFFGWEVQRDLSPALTLGGEVFFQTAGREGAADEAAFNLGGCLNLDEVHHLVGSIGRDLTPGGNLLSAYLACQWTFPAQ